jgi:hypothetical protein
LDQPPKDAKGLPPTKEIQDDESEIDEIEAQILMDGLTKRIFSRKVGSNEEDTENTVNTNIEKLKPISNHKDLNTKVESAMQFSFNQLSTV